MGLKRRFFVGDPAAKKLEIKNEIKDADEEEDGDVKVKLELKKIKDEAIREDLIKSGLLPKPEPIAEGLVMLTKEEHTMIEVIRTYLDGSDAKAVHDWMVVQTGHFSEMMMTQGTAEVQTPPKKKGKKKAA